MSQSTYTLQCISRAVAFMSEKTRDGKTPDLEAIAMAAGLSKYHFNRVYKLATGETPQETLTRFKLARAADQLRDHEVSVTDAAFAAGYGSSQAFAKALKRVLSASATDVRIDHERLGNAIETLKIPQSRGEGSVSIEIAKLEPFEAIAIRTDSAYPALNERYWALFEAAGDPAIVEAILGQPYGDIGPDNWNTLRFDCSLKLSAPAKTYPENIVETQIIGGPALLKRHLGSYDHLPASIDDLYHAALCMKDVKIAEEPLLFHYLDDPEITAEAELRTDVYLPLVA